MTDAVVINVLRVINLAVLGLTFVVLLPAVPSAFRKGAQARDAIWLAFWGDAFNRIWFVGRSIHFDDATYMGWEAPILAACYVFAIAVQLLVLRLYWWGRQ